MDRGGVAATKGQESRLRRFPTNSSSALQIARTVESCDAGCESCDGSCDCNEVVLRCIAERATWTHQRKIRRLKARLAACSDTDRGIHSKRLMYLLLML